MVPARNQARIRWNPKGVLLNYLTVRDLKGLGSCRRELSGLPILLLVGGGGFQFRDALNFWSLYFLTQFSLPQLTAAVNDALSSQFSAFIVSVVGLLMMNYPLSARGLTDVSVLVNIIESLN